MQYSHKEILRSILDYKDFSQTDLAEALGVPVSNINGVITGRLSSASKKILTAIVKGFPEINSDWVMTGEGEMLKSGFGPKKYKPPEPYRLPYLISNLIHLRQVGLLAADNLPSDDIQTSLIHIEEGSIAPTLDMLLFIREHAGIGIDDLLFIDLSTEENMKNAIETVATLKKVREHQKESEEIREALKAMQELIRKMGDRLEKLEEKK